jgi:hypothetical protein
MGVNLDGASHQSSPPIMSQMVEATIKLAARTNTGPFEPGTGQKTKFIHHVVLPAAIGLSEPDQCVAPVAR